MNRPYSVSELKDCSIAVDATYYLQLLLHADSGSGQSFEPLLPALGGMTGIVKRIEEDLDQWQTHDILPFFIFDGQLVVGQDEMSRRQGVKALEQTDKAWELYFDNQAVQAVAAFGSNIGNTPPTTSFSFFDWGTLLTLYRSHATRDALFCPADDSEEEETALSGRPIQRSCAGLWSARSCRN